MPFAAMFGKQLEITQKLTSVSLIEFFLRRLALGKETVSYFP